jgi:hypothetical protein
MATPSVNSHEDLPAPDSVRDARPAQTPRSTDRVTNRRAIKAREQLVADWLRRLDSSRVEARRFRR